MTKNPVLRICQHSSTDAPQILYWSAFDGCAGNLKISVGKLFAYTDFAVNVYNIPIYLIDL